MSSSILRNCCAFAFAMAIFVLCASPTSARLANGRESAVDTGMDIDNALHKRLQAEIRVVPEMLRDPENIDLPDTVAQRYPQILRRQLAKSAPKGAPKGGNVLPPSCAVNSGIGATTGQVSYGVTVGAPIQTVSMLARSRGRHVLPPPCHSACSPRSRWTRLPLEDAPTAPVQHSSTPPMAYWR